MCWWEGGHLSTPPPRANIAAYEGGWWWTSGSCPRLCSRLPPSWAEVVAGVWVLFFFFWVEVRRRFRITASAMRAAPATAATTPATTGVESAADPCSEGVVAGLVPEEGAGVGAGEAAASDGARAAAGCGGGRCESSAAEAHIGCILGGSCGACASVESSYVHTYLDVG